MTKFKPLPTQQELHELFDYSVVTGQLYWKKNRSSRARAGSIAGTKTACGYRRIGINNIDYVTHRLIWCWVTGEDPGTLEVDHVNGDKSCSAWHNLRLATRPQNASNIKATKGYHYFKGGSRTKRWCAEIWVDYKKISLGYFLTEAEAAAAYKEASVKYHGEFSRYSQN